MTSLAATYPGISVPRVLSNKEVHPSDAIRWEHRDARIEDAKGTVVFEQKDVRVPASWSQTALNIVASKYLHGRLGLEREAKGLGAAFYWTLTRHQVLKNQSGVPTLGPAQPLTVNFVEELVRSLEGRRAAEILPENILAKTNRMIAWWTPRQRRQMFYQNPEKKAEELNGQIFAQPPLVWRAKDGELKIRALKENRRPGAETKLAVAPYWNLSDNGTLCTGSMRRPSGTSVATMALWERGFFESAFTHANVGRLTRHPGGFEGLWSGLAGKRAPFPADPLIELPQTLRQFVGGER